MNIENWIEDNSFEFDDQGACIDVSDLRELLKTHAIVPREPNQKTQEVIIINRSSNKHSVDFYGEIIKAAEEEL